MKRFFTILAALVVFSVAASAQLNVTGTASKVERIASARTGLVGLYDLGNVIGVSIPSTNQFEEDEYFYLGKDKESAVKTLEDLVALCDTIDEPVKVEDALGKKVEIHRGSLKALYFYFGNEAGIRGLAKGELRKFLKALQEWK